MTVDAVGLLHRVERRAVFGEDGAAIGDARVGDQDVEIFPWRLAELGLRIKQVHDPQIRRDARQQLVEQRARDVAALRQRPDAFEAVRKFAAAARIARRAHQRMTGGADLRRSIRAAPAGRAPAAPAASAPCLWSRRGEQRAEIEPAQPRAGASKQHQPRLPQPSSIGASSSCIMRPFSGPASQLIARPCRCYMVVQPLTSQSRPASTAPLIPSGVEPPHMKPIRKAVFPVAGLGTRFLPATKAMPKEMLPVVDRPLIQHVVDEARQAGIEHFIFVTGRNKGVIEDHFDRQFELEMTLPSASAQGPRAAGAGPAGRRHRELHAPAGAARPRPRGVVRARIGRQRAVRAAAARRAGEARARLPRADDRRRARARRDANVIAVEEVPMERIHSYGVVGVGAAKGKMFSVTEMVEKPPREKAPSNLIITGRYILQPEIFDILASQSRGAGGEIQLTDAMITLAKTQTVLWPEVRRRELRLRLEDRLPRRQRRLCARSRPTSRRRCARRSSG